MAKKSIAQSVSERTEMSAGSPPEHAEQITRRQDADSLEVRSTSRRIKTVEDLLKHIEADMTKFIVVESQAQKWEVATCGKDGVPTVTELHRVFVRLKPIAPPAVCAAVAAMLDGAAKQLAGKRVKRHKKPRAEGIWQVVVVADCHFGKYCWAESTGEQDYDLAIANRLVRDASEELISCGDTVYRPTRRSIVFIGDLFHYDSPAGATTAGTMLDRDGRLQKMIQVGSDCLLGIVARSAETCQTDVSVVNGNHDETLTWAFARILKERFRNDGRVKVFDKKTSRQYLSHHDGLTLIGIAHGHRAKKRLPQIMAIEAAEEWGKSTCREIHTGHFHSSAAEHQRPIETLDSVVVRTSPALCPSDDWHAQSGFIGARQCMETFFYRREGGLAGMFVAGP